VSIVARSKQPIPFLATAPVKPLAAPSPPTLPGPTEGQLDRGGIVCPKSEAEAVLAMRLQDKDGWPRKVLPMANRDVRSGAPAQQCRSWKACGPGLQSEG